MEARKEKIIALRNAIFEAADGCLLDESMQAIIMAQSRIVAHAVGGDGDAAHMLLGHYREMQSDAMPIYCADLTTQQ